MENTNTNENNKPSKKKEKKKKSKIEDSIKEDSIKLHKVTPDPLIQSIKVNYIFYITSLVCLFLISKYSNRNFLFTIITFIIASFSGFVIHYVSHAVSLEKECIKIDNYFTRNKYVNKMLLFSCKLLDFHDIIHHDSSINKTPKNLLYEFLLNFLTQGGFAIIIYYIAKKLNGYIFLLWGLLYCTIHIVNYNIIPSDVHMKHHLDKTTNYGVDIWDILFRTKYNDDPNEIEIINHYAINVVIITAIIILLIKNNIFTFL